jgi:hypothetical protein
MPPPMIAVRISIQPLTVVCALIKLLKKPEGNPTLANAILWGIEFGQPARIHTPSV